MSEWTRHFLMCIGNKTSKTTKIQYNHKRQKTKHIMVCNIITHSSCTFIFYTRKEKNQKVTKLVAITLKPHNRLLLP